ncbi:heme/hemin ABC transporter substrate-binding protein [Gordonia sp. CPCC 205515]|uniref:heme/hemin ABC transporter substrate-binding protein n=1 Tax=Gordonia sp. CPCC 205515 TaxID=3140791 RepID=UPI003AF36B54
MGALLVALILTLVLGGCTTAPIEQADRSVPASAHLRNGPSTAELPRTDVVPVADNPTPQLPVTVDSVGHPPVTVTDTSRIIAVDRNGTLGNIVFALGLGPRVVGRDTSTAFPSALNKPLVTNTGHTLNAEKVLALRPTVLLVDENTIPPQAVDQIRAAKIPVVAFSATRTLDTTPTLIRSVAAALGVHDAGEALVKRTDDEIAEAQKSVPNPSGNPTIAFVYIRGPRLVLLAGPGSGADDLIKELGGTDAADNADLTGAYTAVTAEAMVKANPDVILVMTQGAESVGGIDGVIGLPGIADTNAGRARRIVEMDQTEILAFGPDIGQVLGSLAQAIYV